VSDFYDDAETRVVDPELLAADAFAEVSLSRTRTERRQVEIEVDLADADAAAEFLETVARLIRARSKLRIRIST